MGRILIIGKDPSHIVAFTDALSAKGLEALVCNDPNMLPEFAGIGSIDCILFIAHSRALWKRDAGIVAHAIQTGNYPIDVLCVLPWASDGPQDRLYGDTLRVEVFHALL